MANLEKLKKKLHSALKLSGFLVRREFSSFIVERFVEEGIQLDDNSTFESSIRGLCTSLEKQNISERSIEKEHIERALEACLQSGCDQNETVFNVINAFQFPRLDYDPDRRLYIVSKTKSKLLPGPEAKAKLFLERYRTVLQRTQRNFKNKIIKNEDSRPVLQTVDYLLTSNNITLTNILILGSLLQVCEGKYCLEDPSGIVQLDLSHAKFHNGFFVDNSFILVNGYYEDKILHVSTIILPPGEEYNESRLMFGNLNNFGGLSQTTLRDSHNLKKVMQEEPTGIILFFSDVWLDHPQIFEKLKVLFDGMEQSPPIAFVFMGDFMEEFQGLEKMDILRRLFKQFGELLSSYPLLVNESQFVFVPGMTDPCSPHLIPRLPLPSYITEELTKFVPKAIFATNPCRLQYCNREISLFRADVLVKLIQGTLCKPKRECISEYATRTIISQGHLSPVSLNSLTIHWDFDYTLRLYPLPNLVVIGDKSELYQGKYKGCQVVNPGSFCDSKFQFISYTPYSDTLDECVL